MSDELPKKPNRYECGVVNFDVSKNVGTHWICYIKDGLKIYVFDSFGGNPPKTLLNYLKGSIKYNSDRIQYFDEVTCGHLCVTVLKMYNEGYNFDKILFILNANKHIWRDYVKVL